MSSRRTYNGWSFCMSAFICRGPTLWFDRSTKRLVKKNMIRHRFIFRTENYTLICGFCKSVRCCRSHNHAAGQSSPTPMTLGFLLSFIYLVTYKTPLSLTLKHLKTEIKNTDDSAGKPWILAFMRMSLNTNHPHEYWDSGFSRRILYWSHD